MNYYSITLRNNVQPIWISDYDSMILKLKEKYPDAVFDWHYEIGSVSGDLHIHGMISTPMILYKSNLWRMVPNGWSMDFGRTLNKRAWENYISKDYEKETDIVFNEYYEEQIFREQMDRVSDTMSASDSSIEVPVTIESELILNRDLMRKLKKVRIV